MNFNNLNRAVKFGAQSTLESLFRAARENPFDETLHGAIADHLEEHYDHPVAGLIRQQFGLGEHAEKGPRSNEWHEPVENTWDGTFPYAARLGKHGPFDLYLAHESPFGPRSLADGTLYIPENQRWVLHAVSNLKGSKDFGYTFEFPHEEAHLIPKLFPAARTHIDQEINEDQESPYHPDNDPIANSVYRTQEANEFDDRMDEEERNRS